MIADLEKSCPEDDNDAYLSWEQRVRKDLTERHGAISEIDRYIVMAGIQQSLKL